MNDPEKLLLSPASTVADIRRLSGTRMDVAEAEAMGHSLARASIKTREEVIAKGKAEGLITDEGGALYKSENVGTQLQGQAFTSSTNANSELAPLVPQSFDGDMKTLVADPEMVCKLTNDLYKQPVMGLVREAVTETDVLTRPLASGFIAEGGLGSDDRAAYSRRVVTVKFEAQRGEISDVAMLVTAATQNGFVPRSLYDTVRTARMKALALIRERNIWWGDSACDTYSYDGYLKDITGLSQNTGSGRLTMSRLTASSSDANLAGNLVTAKFLRDYIDNKYSPTVGRSSIIRKVYLMPQALNALKDEAFSNTRFDGSVVDRKVPIRFFNGKLELDVDHGQPVELIPHPALGGAWKRNSNDSAGGSSVPVLGAISPSAAPSANSLFGSGDAGTYYYRVTGANATGESIPVTSSSVTVASGDSVTMDITISGTSATRFWVERTKVGGASTSTQIIGQWQANTAGSGGSMRIVDDNLIRPYTSPILFSTGSAADVQWESLLPAYVKPLAQTGASAPFLVLDFGSLFIINREKLGIVLNAGFTS